MKQASTHITLVKSLEASTFLEDWFLEWQKDLAHRHSPDGGALHSLPLREVILEALSDASAEQFLTPVTAWHLRRFGRRRFIEHGLWFWVRSEWAKVDLCYGFAPKDGFDGEWDPAWDRGDTGDLGQVEVKVCYAHEDASKRSAKVRVLAEQLRDRRRKTSELLIDRDDRLQRYHGIVWLFEHAGFGNLESVGKGVETTAVDCGLEVVANFARVAAHDDIGRLWPAFGGKNYKCGMSIALFELRDQQDV